ncbi:MAG TPA: hypothetical protein VFI28_00105 [Candidatus Limnocylindrales bacterium]|nr:hypothetical protein [Candidatus Limnocylindrales bacterium]
MPDEATGFPPGVVARVQRERAQRAAVRAADPDRYDKAVEIAFERDPIGLNVIDNRDEYEPEVGTILPRLRGVTDLDQATRIVHEEFVRWFTEPTAGPRDRYQLLAADILRLLEQS